MQIVKTSNIQFKKTRVGPNIKMSHLEAANTDNKYIAVRLKTLVEKGNSMSKSIKLFVIKK